MLRYKFEIFLCMGLLAAGFTTSSCTTTSPSFFSPPKVIERMEGYENTPAFATGRKAMWSEGDQAMFANIVSMRGNSRPEVCLKAAAIDARVEMLRYIKENITSSGQLGEIGAEGDPAYESLTAFLTQGDLSGATVEERYFERREEPSEQSFERVLRLRCAVRLAVSKGHLQELLRRATSEKSEGNPEVRQRLLEAQRRFIESL